jgi:hypothetical protein
MLSRRTKSPAQLDREIAEALARSHPQRRWHHATMEGSGSEGSGAWDVAMDAILENNPSKAAQVVKQIYAEHGRSTSPTSGFSRAVAERASTDPTEWLQIFDRLKPGQIVYIAMTAVMGSGRGAESGNYYPHKVGRRSKSKKPRWWSEALGLEPVDGSKVPDFAKYKLWKRKDGDSISMSHGDMAVDIKGIYAP